MSDIPKRLSRCFSAVFPKLTKQQIAGSSVETVEEWDSVAAATLVTAIEEEFGIEIDMNSLDSLTSFQSMLEYLTSSPAGSLGSETPIAGRPRGGSE